MMRSRHTSNKQPASGVSLSLCSDLCRTLVGSVTKQVRPVSPTVVLAQAVVDACGVCPSLFASRPVDPAAQVAGRRRGPSCPPLPAQSNRRQCRQSPAVAVPRPRGLLAIYVAFERLHASTLHATQCESASRRHGRPGSTGAVLLLSPTQRDDLDNARAAIQYECFYCRAKI